MPKTASNTSSHKPLSRIEDGFLILNDGEMWDYEIHLDCLSCGEQVDRWISHLSSKRWFSPAMKEQMLSALALMQEATQ